MRRIDLAPVLPAAGGLVLFISLFLHWYQPGLSAWTTFEVLDLVLAALGLAALALVVANVAWERPLGAWTLAAIGATAFVVVVSQLLNHPPAAQGGAPQAGAWLGLAASTVMAVGGILQAAGISLVLSPASGAERPAPEGRTAAAVPPWPRRREPSAATEAAALEPEVQDELYPEPERRGPIGADDPEPWTATPDDETLRIDPEREGES